MKAKELFDGVYRVNGKLATENSVPGYRVYEERLFKGKGREFRVWDPSRSKLGAALENNLKNFPIKQNTPVLYLGASSGTTVSHLADITSELIYAVEFAPRMMRDLLQVCEKKTNIVPILADANHPERYGNTVGEVDVIFQDVAQRNQAEILLANINYFKPRYAMLAIKARSIMTEKNPKKVFKAEIRKLKEAGLTVLEEIKLAPYEKDHVLVNISCR